MNKLCRSLECCPNNNCQYATCCAAALKNHLTMCKELNASLPVQTLPFEMYCVCGYSDKDGNYFPTHANFVLLISVFSLRQYFSQTSSNMREKIRISIRGKSQSRRSHSQHARCSGPSQKARRTLHSS